MGEATSGEEAIQVVQETRPDVVMMDMKMQGWTDWKPPPPGAESTRHKVLIMTMYEDGALVKEYMRAGASGFIHQTRG